MLSRFVQLCRLNLPCKDLETELIENVLPLRWLSRRCDRHQRRQEEEGEEQGGEEGDGGGHHGGGGGGKAAMKEDFVTSAVAHAVLEDLLVDEKWKRNPLKPNPHQAAQEIKRRDMTVQVRPLQVLCALGDFVDLLCECPPLQLDSTDEGQQKKGGGVGSSSKKSGSGYGSAFADALHDDDLLSHRDALSKSKQHRSICMRPLLERQSSHLGLLHHLLHPQDVLKLVNLGRRSPSQNETPAKIGFKN